MSEIKIADYTLFGGPRVEYDANAPCRACGEPVVSASMGGTDLCPPCDMGICRHCRGRVDGLPREKRGKGTCGFHPKRGPIRPIG